jgi:hypothetical protein
LYATLVHFTGVVLYNAFQSVCIVYFVHTLDTGSLIPTSDMAPPADQGTGGREDSLWMQPVNGLLDPENDIAIFTNPYMMQPENGFWNLEDNFNFDDIFTNRFMMEAAVGMDGTPRTSSDHINDLVANGSDSRGYSRGYTYANTPRGDMAMEEIQALFTPPFQVADSNIESQHLRGNTTLAEKGQDEPEYVTDARTPQVTKHAPRNSTLSSEEWQKWKPEIYSLYFNGYTLEATRAEMEKKGFYAASVTLPFFSLGIFC